jgi:hypothetical protein
MDLAQEMLAIALQVFTINHQAGRTQETTAGVWRLSGKRYVSSYDSTSQQFSLESLQDKGLRIRGQVEGDTVRVTEAQNIQAKDMAAFQEMRQILEAIPQTPPVKQAVQEL